MVLLLYIIVIALAFLLLPFLLGWSISIVRQRPFWQYLLVAIPMVVFLLVTIRRWLFAFSMALLLFLIGFSLPIGNKRRKQLMIATAILVVFLIVSWLLLITFWPPPDTM